MARLFATALALYAGVGLANPHAKAKGPPPSSWPSCPEITSWATAAHVQTQVTSFCSSYLHISPTTVTTTTFGSPSTTTVTSTATATATTVVTVTQISATTGTTVITSPALTTTSTVTESTSTTVTSTYAPYTKCDNISPGQFKRGADNGGQWPWPSNWPQISSAISSACSCFHITGSTITATTSGNAGTNTVTVHQTATATITAVVTVTSTSTASVTVTTTNPPLTQTSTTTITTSTYTVTHTAGFYLFSGANGQAVQNKEFTSANGISGHSGVYAAISRDSHATEYTLSGGALSGDLQAPALMSTASFSTGYTFEDDNKNFPLGFEASLGNTVFSIDGPNASGACFLTHDGGNKYYGRVGNGGNIVSIATGAGGGFSLVILGLSS